MRERSELNKGPDGSEKTSVRGAGTDDPHAEEGRAHRPPRTHTCPGSGERQGWRGGKDHDGHTGMIYRREGMRHQCWSLVIVSTERGRQVGDEVLHHGLPRSRESPVYRRGHGESVFACASTLVRRGEYRAQTGIWRLLNFVSVRTIKGRSIGSFVASQYA